MLILLDIAFCFSLVWLAWNALVSPNLFRATVLFIVYGMVMAIVWARLMAPDIALAEAAIGAGITGALLLSTLDALSGTPPASRSDESEQAP
jgi:uncharacterized MnhB-related membrane protein